MAVAKNRILVVDDEKNIREALRIGLSMEGFDVLTAEDGLDALNKLENIGADAVILDLRMPRMSGMEFLAKASQYDPDIPYIVLTGHGGVDEAVECMKQGAYDFLTKPINIDKLFITLKRAIEERRRKTRQIELEQMVDEKYNLDNIIGNSSGMRRVLDLVKQVAPTDASVLITGESGTGKEVIANAVHINSKRKNNPFIKVHCAALTETLLESELFGHEKGAFTGALARRKGRFELADGGTIFLDEIGEISAAVQVKLLRVLQEKEFERVGGEETIKVNIRIITATNRDLKKEVESGRFREDLFYRLNVVNLHIPPLRERKEDIILLANFFFKSFCVKHDKKLNGIYPKAIKILENYDWPGNVRELQNVVENAIVLSQDDWIQPDIFPPHIRDYQGKNQVSIEVGITLDEAEKRTILATLEYCQWNKSKASRILGIGRKTLLRKLEEYGLQTSEDDEKEESESV